MTEARTVQELASEQAERESATRFALYLISRAGSVARTREAFAAFNIDTETKGRDDKEMAVLRGRNDYLVDALEQLYAVPIIAALGQDPGRADALSEVMAMGDLEDVIVVGRKTGGRA